MGKSTPSAPQAPDPQVTGAAITKSNIDTANAQAALNHTNQYTPYGSQVWTQGAPDASGASTWSSTTTLSPAQQSLLDSNNAISQGTANLAQQQLSNISSQPAQVSQVGSPAMMLLAQDNIPLKNSASYGNIQNDVGIKTGDLNKSFEDAQKAAYGQQTQYLDSSYGQRQSDLENKLIQQGVLQGSDAWDRELQNLGQQRTFDYNNAFNNSYTTGLASQNQMYNQALSNANFHNSAQQQGFGQSLSNAQLNNAASESDFNKNLANSQLYNSGQQQQFNNSVTNANLSNQGRTQAINELNALRNGSQVSVPQFGSTPQTSIGQTDLASLYNQQYQGQLAQYNAGVAGNNSLTSGLFGLGAAALMSDRRLKTNIKQIGMHPIGIPLYSYDYVWGEPGVGVMADEAEKVRPEAVLRHHPSGYAMVNYGALNG